MNDNGMFSDIELEMSYDKFTIHGQTKEHFLSNGGTEEQWKTLIETGCTDQAHTFGSLLLENATINEVTNIFIKYILHRWNDYIFFVEEETSFPEFMEFLEEHSPVLAMLSTDCIDTLTEQVKEEIIKE